MNWREFYKVEIFKSGTLFFKTSIPVPEEIPMHELFMPKFGNFDLSLNEKKRLCINTRKILHCHHLLEAKHLRQWAKAFVEKIESSKESKIELKTSGAGVYLILAAMELYPHISKTIICHTSEVPLKLNNKKFKSPGNWKLVFAPESQSFLGDFHNLWKESPYLPLFEQRTRKKAA